MRNLTQQSVGEKADPILGFYIIGSAAVFAASYIFDLESGPMYFGLAGLMLAFLCVAAKGLTLPANGTVLLAALVVIGLLNTLYAISRPNTGARWLMIIALYACSLRLTELSPGKFRRTMEVFLPWALLLQIWALQRHLSVNLGDEKSRLIWHTISLFAGLIMALGMASSRITPKLVLIGLGVALTLYTGARGALVGIVALLAVWAVTQESRQRPLAIMAIISAGLAAVIFGGDFLNFYSGIKVVRVTDDPIEHMMKSLEGRFGLFEAGYAFAKSAPWTGTGIGPYYFHDFKSITGLGHPHNSYIGMLIEMGLLLGPLYTAGCIWIMSKAIKLKGHGNLAVLIAPALAYFLVRGMAENYSLLALGNFATSTMTLFACAVINHARD
jgi:hypothetical protein